MSGASERFQAAAILFLLTALAGCGGGGGQAASSAVVPPVSATPGASAEVVSGPVTYLQSSGPLSSTGSIAAGTQSAVIAVMSSATTSAGFANDSLTVASGAATTQSAAVFQSAARPAVPAHTASVEAFTADDRALLTRRSTLATGQTASTAVRTESVLPPTLQIGSSASLWVQQGSLSSTTRANVRVPSTLLMQSAHANIWIDDSLRTGAAASPSFAAGAVLSSTLSQIAADFENAYASDVAHFASPDYGNGAPGLQPEYKSCSSTGASAGTTRGYISEPSDGRINVLVVNSQNLGGLGGYFSGANYMPQSALNCLNGSNTTYESNEAPFIFVGWSQRNGETYDLQEDLVRSTAHELQHLINFVHHAILASAASNPSYNGNETPFINEGLSMLAQDLAIDRMYGNIGVHFDAGDALGRAGVFLAGPGNFSITGFEGIDPPAWGGDGTAQFNCGGGCYGGAYLFQRYLRDRFGGDGYTHAMETGSAVGTQNLQNVTGQASGTLLDDFALALAADSLGVNPSEPRFAFGSLNIAGTYKDQFGTSTALNGLYAMPMPGASIAVQAPIGGFAFVSVPAVPAGGMPLQVTDRASVSGFGMAAGLAQH